MPDTEPKRYMVFLINAAKDKQWCEECGTPQEADDILSRERHRASGYAVFDQEAQAFTKSRNYLAQDYGDD
jgi:hypothetical protein